LSAKRRLYNYMATEVVANWWNFLNGWI